MRKLILSGLVAASLLAFGCDSFNKSPGTCDTSHLLQFMNKYHKGVNKYLAGRLPQKDFDLDNKNDFYVVGNDGVIVAELTSMERGEWYELGTNGVFRGVRSP